MLEVVTVAHLVVWIALFALAGQFVLGLLAGAGRDRNLVYRLFEVIASPFVNLVRKLAPRFVAERRVPLATFVVLSIALVVLTMVRVRLCLQGGVNLCV